MSSKIIVKGKSFGLWTVLEYRKARSLCECRCSKKFLVDNNNLRGGGSRSCLSCSKKGNLNSRKGSEHLPRPLYLKLLSCVNNATARCLDPNHANYGGRGIGVWSIWLKDFHKFIDYLATLPGCEDKSMVLDRIDNDGNYEPGNLRFVSRSLSCLNRRSYAKKLSRGLDGRFTRKEGVFCS